MFRRVLVALCVVGLLAAAVGEAATTGRMKGTVKDNQGIALPGVTVQISSPALIGGPQVAISGIDGGFTFNLLPVGLYTVEASLVGFQAAGAQIRVNLDRVAEIDFNLLPEQFEGEVIVEAVVPVVDTAQVNTQEVFDQEFLQQAAVGTSGRDYLSIISQAAGVAGNGNASVMGGTVGDNAYLIDGLNTTDPLLGTFGTNFNYDAIQEISFQTGGFEAEFGQATGGIINLVTKSGGNEFSGSLDIRYRDQSFSENGDYFDKDEQESSTQNYSATLGGPIIRDKVWFFVSGEYINNKYQADGATFPWNYKGTNYIGKATWQMTDSHRGVFKYSADPAEIPGTNSSRYVFPEAKSLQEQGGDIWQAELNSVLTESLLLNAQVGIVRGYLDAGPESGGLDISGHTDFDTLYDYNNYYNAQFSDRDRDEFRVNSTWFVDQFAGSHEFKAGIEYNDLYTASSNFYPGGAYIYDINSYDPETNTFAVPGVDFDDINGDGYSNYYMNVIEPFETARDTLESSGSITTFFLQDAWRPTSNLTVKPGVRFDNVQLSNHVGDDIADMDRFQPRFGVAWDIMGNAKYVLRGSWGRFMDPTALTIPNFASGVVETYNAYNTMEYYCNRGLPCDLEILERLYGESIQFTNGEGYTYTLFQRSGELSVYDPAQTLDQAGFGSLETPYADELIVAFETQIAPETSIEISYVDKKTKDIIEDTCSNNTWAWGDGDRPSLDDPSTWTAAGGCDFFVITNFDDFYREYEAYIGKFESRGEWWHVLFSWTHSESTGNTYNGARESYATALADVFALDFYNREGYMPDHRPNRLKLSGYVLLPYDITIGMDSWWSDKGRLTTSASCQNYQTAANTYVDGQQTVLNYYGISDDQLQYCYSGDNQFLSGNTIFLEPRGNTESEAVWNIDLQFSKAFRVGSMDMSAVLSIYNLIGEETADTFNGTAFRVTNSAFGDPVHTGYDQDTGEPEYTYYMPIGEEIGWRLPRRYELGFRLEF